MWRAFALLVLLASHELWLPSLVRGDVSLPADFRPDPRAVRREGPAYCYPQAGWLVLHIEGEPYERGYQHGRLLAPEITGYMRCFAALLSPKAPNEGWKNTRALVNSLFLRRYEKEYLEEMKGIADGASSAGGRFDNRPIDLVDIAVVNAWPEIETLYSALEATPTGLEGTRFNHGQPRAMPEPKPMHCSAFAAVGPATADGKIVFGHITMFGLYPALFYNIWLDVKPTRGHRVLMQTYPGGIQSGLDYYINDAGLLVAETTIRQTRFDIKGMTVASRIRQALQYADSIDKAVEILEKDNNGLYTNEWLLADINKNEIAMFELGTAKSKLLRSSKNEWFGGTEGFYWGCNNTKDLEVRLETVASVSGKPENMVWHPSARDQAWLRLYAKHKGKINADFGREAFTTPPIASYPSLDAKYTTTALARELKTWALFGPPLGRTWEPTQEERRKYPEIRPLVSNPWAVLHAQAPAKTPEDPFPVVDRPTPVKDAKVRIIQEEDDKPLLTEPAWHGTVLARTEADTWLATACADYERIVSLEKALKNRAAAGKLTPADRNRLALQLFAHRSSYLAAARARSDVPLDKTRSDLTEDYWYRMASGKGVFVLHELRQVLGDLSFENLVMDSFGRANAGKEVTAGQFQSLAEKVAADARKSSPPLLKGFFEYWLQRPGLPHLKLASAAVRPNGKGYIVEGEIQRDVALPRSAVEVTVETATGEVTQKIDLSGPRIVFTLETNDRPTRAVVDKYGWAAKANGGVFSILSFYPELEQCLIVYGTADEIETNREAAEELQRALLQRGPNITVPFKSDKEVTDAALKSHHLLLIGRPDSNLIVDRFRATLPVTFGTQSFTVNRETFAHPASGVIAAAENPLNPRYSVVVCAGLGAEATLKTTPLLVRHDKTPGEVLVLPYDAKPVSLLVPHRELVQELGERGVSTPR